MLIKTNRLLAIFSALLLGVFLVIYFGPIANSLHKHEIANPVLEAMKGGGNQREKSVDEAKSRNSKQQSEEQKTSLSVSRSFLDSLHITPIDESSGILNENFLQHLNLSASQISALTSASTTFLEAFCNVEAKHAKYTKTTDGAAVVYLEPCAAEVEAAFEHFETEVKKIIGDRFTPFVMQLFKKQFRGSGSEPIDVFFTQFGEWEDFRVEYTHYTKDGRIDYQDKGPQVKRPSFDQVARWKKLAPLVK